MKILKKSLLYDISNMAYVIADTGENLNHTLHRVRDVCQDGNIDRVARVLGLAYANVLSVLFPVLETPATNIDKENSAKVRDYEFNFRRDGNLCHGLTTERKLKIKETVHEYMVSLVLADWLGITLPAAADVWKYKAEEALESLGILISRILSSASGVFRRSMSPF